MNWRELFNPEANVKWGFKLFLLILAILMLASILETVMARTSSGAVLVSCISISLIAYWIREQRLPRRERRRGTRGSERTPVLPHDEEEL